MPHLLNQNCQDKPCDTTSEHINQLSSPPPSGSLPTTESSSSSAATAIKSTDDDGDKSTTTTTSTTPHSSPHKSLSPPTPNQQQQQQHQPNEHGANTSTHSVNADDCDEIKVYNEEGADEDEQRTSDNLTEEKSEIIEAKPSATMSASHPFSVNNLMLFNTNQSPDASTANSPQSANLNPFLLGYRSPLYNPLYSPELASHFASWWPAAAAASALYNPTANPFSAFAYQQQQFAAAAALSRFNPSLFLNAAAAAAAANNNNNNNNNNNKNDPGSTNPHNMASSSSTSSSSSSSSSSASPFSSSSTASSSTVSSSHHKPNQPLQNSKQFNHVTNKIKQEMNPPPRQHNHHQHNHHQHQQQQQHHMNQQSMLMCQAAGMHGLSGGGGGGGGSSIAGGAPPPPPHIQLPSKSKKPHIKKPLNAFMLFMKEQRAKVVNECTLRESAAINQILGRKWHELERGEQAKYYEMARQERLKHMQLYPGWSARDNYGLKKKRRRKREKVIGENGELPRKCRARYGLQQINLWCKPCRRKKKCIRFAANNENAEAGSNGMSGVSPMIMGPNGHMYPNPMYNAMMMSGDSAAGSVNGANSEDEYEDDFDEMGDELLPGGQEDETDNDDDDNDDDDDTDSEDDENELTTTTATNTKDLAMAHHGFTSSPMYHPNKKANLDTGAHPLSQIQQQFHQQFQQSMDSSKHDLMQHIQQMHHQFQSGHAAINALNYSSMFNGVALNEPAHTAAPN